MLWVLWTYHPMKADADSAPPRESSAHTLRVAAANRPMLGCPLFASAG
jgi:hypothetical protein